MTRLHLLMALILNALISTHTDAHEGRPVYVEVEQQNESLFLLRWKIPPVLKPSDMPLIRLSGKGCTLMEGPPRPSLIGNHLYQCTGRPEQVDIKYPSGNPVLTTLVLFQPLGASALNVMAGPDEGTIRLPHQHSLLQVATDYSSAGTSHILEGYDHLLFVLCLMLLAKSPGRILLAVTGFTVGHSITLGMATLGHLSLPPALVEPLIAFSILLLAAEALKDHADTWTSRYPALVATGFGLLHGLGFAGALAEVGLPPDMQLPALLFFNLGVEFGQLLFVLSGFLAFIAIKSLLRKNGTAFHTQRMQAAILYPAGIVAGYWTFDRVVGIWL